VRILQASPGPGHVVVATLVGGGRQSEFVQQVVLPIQMFPQTSCPVGQLHVPPGPEQVSPVTLHPVAGQQLVVGMQLLLVVQKVCPVGQLQEPPGPEHVPPPTHWAVVQQLPCGMHALNAGDAMVQTEPLFGQTQSPPGPVQVSPVTRQSLLVQQVFCGMHALLTVQTLFPAAHWHDPPGPEHVSPEMELQSAFVQHAVLGMQALFAVQAV